jgi:putative transposase
MIRKEKFVPGQYYHIYSRVILNVPEFKDKKNAERLALNFWIANSTKSDEVFRYLGSIRNRSMISHDKILKMLNQGERIVDVLCYIIMPDHYHLLLRERKERGINKFIHKCNTSVAKYINIKNNRRGPLFENRFQSRHIDTNDYLLHLSLYIHLNPLDFLVGKEWREHKIKNWTSAREKIFNYPWSSLKTYLDDNYKNYIVSGIKIIKTQFDTKNDYESFLRGWSGDQLAVMHDVIMD